MAAAAKYLFDMDFGGVADAKSAVTAAELTAKLADAEARGHRKGFAEAQAQASAETAAALGRIAEAFDRLGQTLRGVEAKLEAEAVEVAVAVGCKLAPALIGRDPFAEIAALSTECFRQLVAAPHVVVSVNDALYEAARQKLDEVARSSGFEGRLVIMAEPEIPPGDCRIEWADGGLNRDSTAAEAAIAAAVDRYVTARCSATTPHDNPGRLSP